MSQNANRLLGFPLKVFVKSKQIRDNAKPVETKFQTNNDGQEVKEFYENLPVSSCSEPSKDSASWPSDPPSSAAKTKRANYSISQLFKAVSSNDLDLIVKAIKTKSGRDILTGQTDHFGWSALMIASCNGHLKIAELLMRKGSDTKVRDKAGHTCLSLATKSGHSLVADLIVRGPRPESHGVAPKEEKETLEVCQVCEESFRTRSSYRTHLASTTHRLKVERREIEQRNGKLKAYYGIGQSNRGYQMMIRNDKWDPDSGLGKEGEGKLYPVKTVLKRDRRGLGTAGGDAPTPRVTHFGPYDPGGVASLKSRPERLQRTGTQVKVKRRKQHVKETRKEIDFRREFL